jgi:transcriptional regulator with XRE-family HTH domain
MGYFHYVNTNTTIGGGLLGGIMDGKEVCILMGQAVKRLRCQNEWTQERLAEKLEISANFLSNIENGKAWVSPTTISKLAFVFKVAPHELFMPEHDLSPTTQDVFLRYTDEVEESITVLLDKLKHRYLG